MNLELYWKLRHFLIFQLQLRCMLIEDGKSLHKVIINIEGFIYGMMDKGYLFLVKNYKEDLCLCWQYQLQAHKRMFYCCKILFINILMSQQNYNLLMLNLTTYQNKVQKNYFHLLSNQKKLMYHNISDWWLFQDMWNSRKFWIKKQEDHLIWLIYYNNMLK